MISEALSWLASEAGLLVPKRCCSKDPVCYSKLEVSEGSQLPERCCFGDSMLYKGAFNSESAIRLLFNYLMFTVANIFLL